MAARGAVALAVRAAAHDLLVDAPLCVLLERQFRPDDGLSEQLWVAPRGTLDDTDSLLSQHLLVGLVGLLALAGEHVALQRLAVRGADRAHPFLAVLCRVHSRLLAVLLPDLERSGGLATTLRVEALKDLVRLPLKW